MKRALGKPLKRQFTDYKPGILLLGADCLLNIFSFLDYQLKTYSSLKLCCRLFQKTTCSPGFFNSCQFRLQHVSSQTMVVLPLKVKNLKVLKLYHTDITWSRFACLGDLNLRSLSLQFCYICSSSIPGELLENKFSNLESFKMNACRSASFDDLCVSFLKYLGNNLKKLSVISGYGGEITSLGRSLQESEFLPTLISLKLNSTSENVTWLRSCVSLKSLYVNFLINGDLINAIGSLLSLESLQILNKSNEKFDIYCLGELVLLKTLTLSRLVFIDASWMAQLDDLNHLELIYINDIQLPQIPNLQSLQMTNCERAQFPKDYPFLTSLRCSNCEVPSMSSSFTSLENLDLFDASIPNEFNLRLLVNLKSLDLRATGMVELHSVGLLSKLEKLAIGTPKGRARKCNISKKVIDTLLSLKKLRKLTFENCNVKKLDQFFNLTDLMKLKLFACAADLRCSKACGKLAVLDLTGTRVDNDELLSFSRLKTLRLLHLGSDSYRGNIRELSSHHRALKITGMGKCLL